MWCVSTRISSNSSSLEFWKEQREKQGPSGDPPPAPSNVPPTDSNKEPRVVPPGVGPSLSAAENQVAPKKLLEALQLLQTVMSAEDISKYEKMVVPLKREEQTKEREQLLLGKGSIVEQIAELEAQASQQRSVLQEVQEQLEAVNDGVCALRALVADPS